MIARRYAIIAALHNVWPDLVDGLPKPTNLAIPDGEYWIPKRVHLECGLKVRDVDLGNNAIRVLGGKGFRDRAVCISGECVHALLAYLNEYPRERRDYLFTTLVNGGQYTAYALRKLLKTVAVRTGIKKWVYPHLLRHSLATNLIARGANLLTVKEQLGHAWIDSTMIYITSRFQRIMVEYHNFAPSYL